MPRLLRPALLIATLALALVTTGCATSGAAPSPTPFNAAGMLGTWTVHKTFTGPEQPFVAFEADGTWISSDGCNRVQGTWKANDTGALTTTSGPQTRMGCDGAQLPLAVTLATSATVSGDTMTLVSSGDSTTTELVRATDPKVGPQGLPIGYWVESAGANAPFLNLSADRTFSGSDGCNTLVGSWTTGTDGTTSFGHVASTLMACAGSNFWLSGLATATVSGSTMTILGADGSKLGTLSAQ